ncbi:hypothetical protein ACE193_07465 [Bernardetia sp. OM2101]|uniref:hypothetical protein n=1 Tax=Bernardetia sp. OM2101 TaxID=3344876 RepID=UPI0035D0FEC3
MTNLKLPIFLLFVIFIIATSCSKLINENITLICSYQMYACGDCRPQFLVQDIKTNNQIIKKNLLNQDIYVAYEEGKKDILEGIKKCMICYTFTVTGRLEKKDDDYILLAKDIERNFHSNCCNK